MRIETEAAGKPEAGALNRGKGILKVLAGGLLVLAVCGWIAFGIGLYLDVERNLRLALAIGAGVATEALFWTVAALLGISVVEARKRIWRRITGRASVPPAPTPQP
ncbi:MAG: hypothetical protein Q8S03_12380 [Brevundimonas sp.]|uniref:hypothetical protein n=1 Tax=Brevundimonas sp. TaxID=1871086 RepID=UPI00273301BC|nr:hypothetical protein [Brevundimonas sp.]MDP3405482.1 hypothetical protein [Brevundimonas sp.]